MDLNREVFEQAIVAFLREKRVLSLRRELILGNLDNAELVTVRGEDLEGHEIWIPGLETVLEDGLVTMTFDDATLHVGGPPTDGWPTSRIDVRMDIVNRRPLFA